MKTALSVDTLDASAGDQRERFAGYAIVALLLIVLVGLRPFAGETKTEVLTGDGDTLRQLSYLLVFGFAILGLKVYEAPLRRIPLPLSLLLLLGWCALSMFWAIEPMTAFRRLALTVLVVVTVFATVERAGIDRTLRAARLALLVTLIANYVAIAISPTAVHQYGEADAQLIGAWRGVMMQKNFAGAACSLTILFFFFGPRPSSWWLKWLVIAASAYFLYETKSKTSIALVGVSLMIGVCYRYLSYNLRQTIAVSCLLVLLGFLVLGDGLIGQVTHSVLQPDALTGRGDIWPVLLAYASENPILGAGYGSFWNIGPGSPVHELSRDWVAELGNGHNGYLDLLVSIGMPGLVLAIFATIVIPLCRLVTGRAIPSRSGALVAAVLVFCAAHNLTESSLLDRDMIVWVVQVFAIALAGHLANAAGPASIVHRPGR